MLGSSRLCSSSAYSEAQEKLERRTEISNEERFCSIWRPLSIHDVAVTVHVEAKLASSLARLSCQADACC